MSEKKTPLQQSSGEISKNLKIKDSLVFSVRNENEGHQYIVEDIFSEKYFRIGEREYSFIIQLDGVTPLGNALKNANLEHEETPLDKRQATEIVTWLLKENLLANSREIESLSVVEPTAQNSYEKWLKKMNVIFFRLPLLNPDAYLDDLLPKLSWLVSKTFILIWLFLLLTGVYHVIGQWSRFEQSSLGVFYPLNWLWLIVGYIIIKTSHEIFHGLISKHYGGSVNEAGIIFVLFIPIGYVNATSSWHFPNKWQRFHTAVAGMFIELFFAGIACWVWAYTDKGPLNNFAYNIIVIASVSTILFNANPLMRFDGYFALSDALNIPNLYARGRQYVQYLMRRYILGQKVSYPDIGGRVKITIIKAYGIASAVWRIFIVLFILVAAYSLFYGAGIVLAGIALLAMLLPPIVRQIKALFAKDHDKSSWGGISLRLFLLVSIIGVALTQISWSRDIIAPGVVDYASEGVIKTDISGFVKQVNVKQGDIVDAGDILARLENKELETDLEILKNQIARARSAARVYLNRDQLAEYKIENESIAALKKQLDIKQQQVNNLTLYASVSGTIATNQLYRSVGQYVEAGETLAYIGNRNDKRVYISVLQKDQYDSNQLTQKVLKARINNDARKNISIKIHQETPRAYKSVSYPQLSNTNGGPLAVVPKISGVDASGSKSSIEYVEPRAELVATIAPVDANYVYAGQIALVRLPAITKPLGKYLYNKFSSWINHLFDRERW